MAFYFNNYPEGTYNSAFNLTVGWVKYSTFLPVEHGIENNRNLDEIRNGEWNS